MKTDRSQCAIFWLLSAATQAALMEAYYADAGTKLNIPLTQETSSDWDTSVSESPEEIEKIMCEAPRHQRKVD